MLGWGDGAHGFRVSFANCVWGYVDSVEAGPGNDARQFSRENEGLLGIACRKWSEGVLSGSAPDSTPSDHFRQAIPRRPSFSLLNWRASFPGPASTESTYPQTQLANDTRKPCAPSPHPSIRGLLRISQRTAPLRRYRLPFDPADKLVLLMCRVYLPVWFAMGLVVEVRIFVRYLFLRSEEHTSE